MAFQDERLPTTISYGARGGPGWITQFLETHDGGEQAIARRSDPRHEYDISYGLKSWSDVHTLKKFFMARGGSENTWRYKDWTDFATTSDGRTDQGQSVTETDSWIGVGDGSTTTFQIVHRYQHDSKDQFYYTRTITKPVSGTLLVAIDDTKQTEGGGNDYTVNYNTGVITFNTAPARGLIVQAGCEFDVECRFGEETDQLLQITIDSFAAGSLPSIQVIEEINTNPEPQLRPPMAGKSITITDHEQTLLDPSWAGPILVTDNSSPVPTPNHRLILPDPQFMQMGGPYYLIHNQVAGADVDIYDKDGNYLIELDFTDDTTWCFIVPDANGAKKWHCWH